MRKKYPFGITEGSGTRRLGTAFSRPADAPPLSLIVDKPAPSTSPLIDPQLSQLVPVTAEHPTHIPDGNWLVDCEQPQYSEKIKLIKTIFDQQVQSATFKYLYICLTDNGELKPLTSPIVMPVRDADNFLKQTQPFDHVIMSLDLTRDFDEQLSYSDINVCFFNNWYELINCPFDGLMSIKALEHDSDCAPITIGLKRPVLVWENKP